MVSIRKALTGAALVGCTLGGGAIGAALIGNSAGAQTSTTTQPAPAAPSQDSGRPAFDPTKGGHQANGKTETLLTGSDADKAKAAALAAVPGGTIQRVETDADGEAVYEAHMLKSDGTPVTVLMDKDFKVTGTEAGPHGPGGPGGPHGPGGPGRPGGPPPTTPAA